MCTAVRIVVAAADRERRLELRRAAVTAEWEVVGEADGPEAAYGEAVERRARFLVLDASAAGPRPEVLVRRLRSTSPNAFVVGVGLSSFTLGILVLIAFAYQGRHSGPEGRHLAAPYRTRQTSLW